MDNDAARSGKPKRHSMDRSVIPTGCGMAAGPPCEDLCLLDQMISKAWFSRTPMTTLQRSLQPLSEGKLMYGLVNKAVEDLVAAASKVLDRPVDQLDDDHDVFLVRRKQG